jgi:hypothetical protein
VIRGVDEAVNRLERVDRGLSDGPLKTFLNLAAGLAHRYLMGLSKDRPPVDQSGVLPVITGRLKNSFFWGTRSQGGPVGFVATNLSYAPAVEKRRGFLGRTVRDTAKPINDLFAGYGRNLTA